MAVIGLVVFVVFPLVILLGYCIGIYNRLVFLKNSYLQAWANIDVILKQRHDELPKLINVCESYMKYEKKLLENITALRSQAMGSSNLGERVRAEQQLGAAISGLFAVAENYPDLKSNQNFLNLQNRISHLEDQIADRREYYNNSTTIYNTRIAQVPENLIAAVAGFLPQELYRVAETERKDVSVDIKVP